MYIYIHVYIHAGIEGRLYNSWAIFKRVLGQLPTGDNSPPDKNKAQLLPTRTTIPIGQFPTRTTPPHQDHYHLVKPLIRTNIYGGELSWWGVVRIRFKILLCSYFHCFQAGGQTRGQKRRPTAINRSPSCLLLNMRSRDGLSYSLVRVIC